MMNTVFMTTGVTFIASGSGFLIKQHVSLWVETGSIMQVWTMRKAVVSDEYLTEYCFENDPGNV